MSTEQDRRALVAVLRLAICQGGEEQYERHRDVCMRVTDYAYAILAAGWVSPDTHRRAVEEAREQGAGDLERAERLAREDEREKAARRLAEVEAERDDWKRRHARVQEMYRERFNAGVSNADWHAQHCAAIPAVERVRALADEWGHVPTEYIDGHEITRILKTPQAAALLRAALDGAADWVDIHRDCSGNWHVDDGIRYCDDCGYAEHVLIDATRPPVRKREGGRGDG